MQDEEIKKQAVARSLAEPFDWVARAFFARPTIELPEGYHMKIVRGPKGDNLFVIEPKKAYRGRQ